MEFTPKTLSIEEMFSDAKSYYQMPIYQRPYSWGDNEVERLWFDILDAYKKNADDPEIDQNYFLGSAVVIEKKGNNFMEVVDGQQRLTTLTILFCTLRDMKPDLSLISTISGCIKIERGGKERFRLSSHVNNQAYFEENVLKENALNNINFDLLEKPKKGSKKKKYTIENNTFLNTAYVFQKLIKMAFDPENENYVEHFEDFVEYLFTKTLMIRIACDDESFAIKLFSVLNDRGLDLTTADIIKAHLLYKSEDEDKRDSFIEVWKRIEHSCNEYSKEKVETIFAFYYYYLKCTSPKKSLQDELKIEFNNKDPQAIILEIEEFANIIRKINQNNKDKDISMLKYLPHSIYWKSILITAIYVKYPFYKELKSLITKYFYQSWIADGTSNRIKQTSLNILKIVKGEDGVHGQINKIKEEIVDSLKNYPDYSTFLNKDNVYSTRWHKSVLLAIEYYQQDDRDFIEISKDLHTEHVLPRGWDDDKLNWSEYFTEEDANKWVNKLGNLTLLSGTKNIAASNQNFADKMNIYKGKGEDGITSFEISKKIIEKKQQWTPEAIQQRHDWLISEAKRIFEIK